MSMTDWPVAFFDDDYLRIYRAMLSPEVTAREVDFIDSALALPPGGAVLDVACGRGRHAIGLARRGYRVTGVDFNPRYLALAEEDAAAAGTAVRWVAADMRELPFEGDFDGAYSFFTSFGYFSDEENERALAGVARALRPGGRFLLDVTNRDSILTHPQQRLWTQLEDGSLLMEEVSLDLRRSQVRSRQIHITPSSGAQITKEFTLRAYTCAELEALCARHGLAVREVWGGSDRSAYSTESRRLVLLAERESEVRAGSPAGSP
jgi:SAM-dependent methyltransferase